mmetsp:Transcript_3744/g.5805  ORF Transcript_3744/g.5805 Transcript_3744/m.5805 type:complete len:450 (-) Transcript_3744:65-1414(-)
MGNAKSTSVEPHIHHSLKRTNSEKKFHLKGDKHIPEYPPLLVCKDSGSQTNVSYANGKPKKTLGNVSMYKCALLGVVLYVTLCTAAMFSTFFQSAILYMNILNFPFGPLTNLNRFGLSDGRNIELAAADGTTIRGWHILPPGRIARLGASITSHKEREEYFDSQLKEAEVIVVYFHGNAGNRALPRRISLLHRLASQLSSHVITIDYRGFGDSAGWPSEGGTALDARAVWEWIERKITMGEGGENECESGFLATTPRIFLYGQSLGSAIATELAHSLNSRESHECGVGSLLPAGLILNSAFVSVRDAAKDYPHIAMFRLLPLVSDLMASFITFSYNTASRIGSVGCPVLLLHGARDWTIPSEHSWRLIQAVADTAPNGTASCVLHRTSVEDGGKYSGAECLRQEACPAVATMVEIPSAGHESVHESNEWLAVVPKFVESILNENSDCLI